MSAKAFSFVVLVSAALAAPVAAAEATRCDVALAVTDPDPKGLNVRATPDAKGSILAVLKGGDYIEVHVTGQDGQWYAIDSATLIDTQAPQDKTIFRGHGFVHMSKVGASGLQGGSVVFDKPDDKSGKVIKWDQGNDDPVNVLGCSGVWAKVQGKKAIGWSKAICTNMLTTCV
jgi:hypothetical protein